MTTMTWGNSEGTKGRCDAKCHDATHPDCDCMCGGRYHGRGLTPGGIHQAIAEYGDEVMVLAEQRATREGLNVTFLAQRDLFGAVDYLVKTGSAQ